jgi:hypothetical protein
MSVFTCQNGLPIFGFSVGRFVVARSSFTLADNEKMFAKGGIK